MILKAIILKNFRGYNGEHRIDVSDGITALIGKNDAGKSTLLEALDIFYGESKPELADLNIYAEEREMVFGAVFTNLPESISVDTSATTSLSEEYLVNKDGDFEIVIKYACTAATMGKPEQRIRCQHPSSEKYSDLLTLKLIDLKARGKELGVKAEDERVNNLWRKTIWSQAPNLDIKEVELKIDEFDTKAKAIYTNIQSLFPQFFLFRVDRQTSDGDAEAKDPMQLAVKEAQKEFQADIQLLQAKIQERVDEVAARALVKLQEMDKNLASQLKPELKGAPKWSFDYKINDDRGVSLNKRGSGTRRLVLLNFFRAEAERKAQQGSGNIIYAIEEPETSQHPNNQEMIIDSLLELSQDATRQVIITSHSPHLVEKLPRESVRFIEFDNASKNTTIESSTGGLMKAADSLGIHSKKKFGSAKAVVLVEGKDDDLFLSHASSTLKSAGKITHDHIGSHSIEILTAGGGDNVAFWVQKTTLENLGLPFFVFLDSDRLSATDPLTKNEKLVADIILAGNKAATTRKREIENYIDASLTNSAVYGDFDDAKVIISHSDGLKDRKGKPRKVFSTHWPNMTAPQLEATSKYIDSSGKSSVELIELLNDINDLI
jgi:putative ATP-dependent endonuclease of OLD family